MFQSFINYLKETRIEMKKVNWPTRSQTVTYTITVIIISVIIALILGGFDLIFREILLRIV